MPKIEYVDLDDEEEVKEQQDENKPKRKPRRLKSSLIAIALSAIIATTASAIKMSPFNVDGSLEHVLEKNKQTTMLDDIFGLDETINIKNIATGELEQWQVEDAVFILEDCIEVNNKIKALKINGSKIKGLPEEEKTAVYQEYLENGIDTIIESYNSKDKKIEKARIAQKLLYILERNTEWLETNGKEVSESLLRRVLAAGALDAYGTFNANEYKVVELNLNDSEIIPTVTLKDEISGEEDNIMFTPILAHEYSKAYKILEYLESYDGTMSTDTIIDNANKALEISKRCINKEIDTIGSFAYTKEPKEVKQK